MNDCNFTGTRMKARDWKRIPPHFRKREGNVWMILKAGKYTPVLIVD
jgi:hypothetical protein